MSRRAVLHLLQTSTANTRSVSGPVAVGASTSGHRVCEGSCHELVASAKVGDQQAFVCECRVSPGADRKVAPCCL